MSICSRDGQMFLDFVGIKFSDLAKTTQKLQKQIPAKINTFKLHLSTLNDLTNNGFYF